MCLDQDSNLTVELGSIITLPRHTGSGNAFVAVLWTVQLTRGRPKVPRSTVRTVAFRQTTRYHRIYSFTTVFEVMIGPWKGPGRVAELPVYGLILPAVEVASVGATGVGFLLGP